MSLCVSRLRNLSRVYRGDPSPAVEGTAGVRQGASYWGTSYVRAP